MSMWKRLVGRLWDGAARDEKSEEAPPLASSPFAPEAAPAGSHEAVVHALVKQIVEQSENELAYDSIDPNAVMCDRGYLDSLTYVAFLVFVEETYGVRIADYQLTSNLRTVSAVADWVLAESKDKS